MKPISISDSDAIIACEIQQAACRGDTPYNYRWAGGTVLEAARIGLGKGRELERAYYEEQLRRRDEVIEAVRHVGRSAETELAALRIECNGLRTRLELVRQALVKPI